MNPKVFAHTSYIGTGGYNNHSRDFFRHLSKLIKLKIRNFTIGDNWKGPGTNQHDSELYLNNLDKKLLHHQSLWASPTKLVDSVIYPDHSNDFKHNVNIVLAESNHHYYYDSYNGPKIGYNVWESTKQPTKFFNQWCEFDQMWVPSKWQAECTIEQGADPNKVKIVPEGVDTTTFFPEEVNHEDYDGRFKFVHFGRWDYRKSTKEIIEAFLSTFSKNEPVDLILSVDNKFGDRIDGLKTTEERLKYWGLEDERIKIKHFPSREDYIKYLKKGHVFLSCARSEGWNLPLIEAMACGTPSIYSNCSGQLEFAEGKGLPVKIIEERPTTYKKHDKWTMAVTTAEIPGNYYEPDFEDLKKVMRDAYINYDSHKVKAIKDAKIIHDNFNWDKVAEIGNKTLKEFLKSYKPSEIDTNKIIVTYNNGPKVEIVGNNSKEYHVEFINTDNNEVIHDQTIKNNMWVRCGREYYTNWSIRINNKIYDRFDLEGKDVLIQLESNSIGDTIAWAPYAVDFKNKYKCNVTLSTFHNHWFKSLDKYKNINFRHPGSAAQYYATYRVGWYKKDGKWESGIINPNPVNLIPLQQTATDILGLDFKETNYGVDLGKGKRPIKEKYVVFGPQATAGCKEWVFDHWCKLAGALTLKGYKIVVCSLKQYNIPNSININKDLETTATYLKHADYFIGLGSGLSWLNWALGKHTIMINGFSKDGHEFTSNLTRVTKNNCINCWNDPVHVFDGGDWDWCPVYKGTELQHTCQKSILPNDVLKFIK